MKKLFKPGEHEMLVSWRTVDPAAHPPFGSITTRCRDCGSEIWLAPTSQALLGLKPHLSVMCFNCWQEYEHPSESEYMHVPEILRRMGN